MDVRNALGGTHAAIPMKDTSGRSVLGVIVKLTFAIDPTGKAELVEEGAPEVDLADTYNGDEPAKASIRKPSQVFDYKPGTDVLLIGHAHPPLRGRATCVDVSLRVGPIAKTVRAHGLRVWMQGAFGRLSAGPAQPIRDPVPLIYELAWGGMDTSDPMRPVGEVRNYVGRGIAANTRSLVGQPAAQLEDPKDPIGGLGHDTPMCFGAIHRHWQPRASFAGTYDQAWMDTRMPLLPEDFDPRFHVSVPPDQWSQTPLRGDEPFEIIGATPEGFWRFQLPRIVPAFMSVGTAGRIEHRTFLDTILIDADAYRVELTYRASVPIPKKLEMLDHVRIFEKELLEY